MTTHQVNTRRKLNLQLDPGFFKWNRIPKPQPINENTPKGEPHYINIFERITLPEEGGILRHYAGLKQPIKGFPFPEAINAIDIIKAYTMSMVYTLTQKELKWSVLCFLFLSWKKKIKIIENALSRYLIFADRVLNKVTFKDGTIGTIYLQKRYYSNFARELWDLVANFLVELGINRSLAERIGEIVATLFEYDDAYRYRFEDIMSETDNYTLRSQPRAELKRLGDIMVSRELVIKGKIEVIIKVLRIMFLSRKVREAFRVALFTSNFQNLQLDKIDKHCVLKYGSYNFMGMTEEERLDMYYKIYEDNLPPVLEVE